MSHTIEIDDEVFQGLKQQAEPFVDTPNTVLRRMLGLLPRAATTRRAKNNGSLLKDRKSRRVNKGSSERAPTGSILPESEYVLPLLEVLAENGGRAPAREVIDAVGRRLDGRLTGLDRETVSSGGLRWQNRIQFARLKLIDRGLIKKASPRGLWEITDKGTEFITAQSKN